MARKTSKTRKFQILAARAKTGKQSHVRKFRDGSTTVEAKSAPAALRAYGVNAKGKTRTVVTKNGWKLSAKPVK